VKLCLAGICEKNWTTNIAILPEVISVAFLLQLRTNLIMKLTNKMQIYRLIYYSWLALHVSGDVFAHHQEHLTVFTVSVSIHPSCCRLVSWMSWNTKVTNKMQL